MSRSNRFVGLMTTASILALSASAAHAQQQAQAQGLALEEITVTARKVEENLMTVPVAVTAFSEKDIEAINIKQLTDVMLMTPSFNFVNQVGGSGRNDRGTNSLVFRGLFLANNSGLNGGGQMFIDGAPVIGAHQPAIVDVARIEVLKGPQSAYFGRSTFVGAINFIMREPGNEFKGRVTAEASSWNSHDLSLSFEGPIVEDKLAARVTGRNFRRGGQYTNATNPGSEKLGRQTTGSLSGSLVFTPTDSLKVKAYANWFEDNDGAPAQGAFKQGEFTGRVNADGSCTPFSATAPRGSAYGTAAANSRASLGYLCGTVPKVNDSVKKLLSGDYDLSNIATRNAIFNPNPNFIIFDPQFKQDGGVKRHAFQADIRMDYETTNGYTISSLTAHHHDRAMTILDLNYRDGHDRVNPFYTPAFAGTRVPWMQFIQVSQNKTRDWSQELRISSPQDQSLRWTFGGNYLDAHTPGGPVYGISQTGANFSSSITAGDVSTPAVFGAAYFDFTESLTLSAEARYQWDKIKSTPKISIAGTPVVNPTVLEDTFKSFSPRVSLDWNYAEGSTAYALFSRGYRPGGFNAALVTASPAVLAALVAVVPNAGLSYEQEKLDNYEIGLKSTWLDGRARTVLTAYYDEWIGGQVANSIPVTAGGITNLIGLTVNNGKAALKGLEFEGQFQVTEELKLSGTAGINDTEIKTYGLGVGNCSDCNNIYGSFGGAIGNRLPTTPKYTWTASAEYTAEFSADYDWYSRVDYMHQGSKFTDFSNVLKVGSSDNVNARIGIRNETMSIEAFVTNLTQNKVATAALLGVDVFTFIVPPNANEVRFSPPLPRSVGVRASYNF